MAFDIALDPQDTGHLSRYWRITQMHVDHAADLLVVWLHGWRDEAARLAGRAAAGSLQLHLRGADLPGGLHAADTAAVYNALKLHAAGGTTPPLGTTTPATLAGAADC